jgi:ABC-type nitrate/sulfonate/bicarbonate transport system substrate-binding protein
LSQSNSDTLVSYIQALLEGNRWIHDPANKAEATQILVDRLQLPPDAAAKSYALAIDPKDGMYKDVTFNLEGFRNVLKLRAEIEGKWGGSPPPVDRYFDPTYHAKALAGLR